MQPKPHDYIRSRKTQTIIFTIAAAILSIGLVVAMIFFLYQSNHLHL